MRYFIFLYIFIFLFSFNSKVLSSNILDSEFYNYDIETSNINQTKTEIIDEVKKITLYKVLDIILDERSLKKFKRTFKNKNINNLVQNIIIENEIITNKKYIASIKINFDINLIIDHLRNNKINYTDLESKPFLIISTYSFDFLNIGLDKNNLFNINFYKNTLNQINLINYNFPNLDHNDRYIAPYEKIINYNQDSFDQILNKYDLNQLIYFKIEKNINNSLIDVNIYQFSKKTNLEDIGNFSVNYVKQDQSNELFTIISNKSIFHLSNWWKKNNQIDNKIFSNIECKIITNDFVNLIKLKSAINLLNQVKYLENKKIEINNNIINIFYYGNIDILKKKLLNLNILLYENDECVISNL